MDGVSRRGFVELMGAAAAALAVPPAAAAAAAGSVAAVASGGAAVLAIHMDQPYVDFSGRAEPYRPPLGARGCAPLEPLDPEALARLTYAL